MRMIIFSYKNAANFKKVSYLVTLKNSFTENRITGTFKSGDYFFILSLQLAS